VAPLVFAEGPRRLLGKYQEMLRLRQLDEAGDTADPRAAMRTLAADFPSALRELDRLPMATIIARVAELERVVRGEAPEPDWVSLQLAVHGWLQIGLRVKAAAGMRRDRHCAFEAVRDAKLAATLGVTDDDVEVIVAPPGGRLVSWVHERVARSFGTTVERVVAAFTGE
jgi:hypothetical protein